MQRARSVEAKQQREQDILAAARDLATARGIRQVTLTDIADAVGMHKSALLRYFETREQIFLLLTAEGWRDWGPSLCARLADLAPQPVAHRAAEAADDARAAMAERMAEVIADSLVGRPMFCDLLAQAPLNLERNVSLESVREFKLVTLEQVDAIVAEFRRLRPGLTEEQGVDLIATATSMAGALWQMATPGPETEALYRSDPKLGHAIVEVGPRLTRVLTAVLRGFEP
ncbi:TetR/AcrR family transcriptional regulator [Cryptosporangium sp. NPDC048952]|uniref:TetR/AcrR family transcriptional regulator n=1 Tax=Cryptosporangium sp. NPDC048952 TaxID=3363961 RepID=UPI0037111E92